MGKLFNAFQHIYDPDVPAAADLMECVAELYTSNTSAACPQSHYGTNWPAIGGLPGIGGLEIIAQVLGVDYAGHFTELSFLQWWRTVHKSQPLGITRSLTLAAAVDAWPALPRPHPPVGSPLVAPLVIGNLFDAQTPYQNAQSMLTAFPNGQIMTWQGYG